MGYLSSLCVCMLGLGWACAMEIVLGASLVWVGRCVRVVRGWWRASPVVPAGAAERACADLQAMLLDVQRLRWHVWERALKAPKVQKRPRQDSNLQSPPP